MLGVRPPTSQPPFSAWCQSEEPRGPYGQGAGCTSCLCWEGLQPRAVVTGAQMTKLDKSFPSSAVWPLPLKPPVPTHRGPARRSSCQQSFKPEVSCALEASGLFLGVFREVGLA